MMILKNKEEIELMRQSALLVSKTLAEVARVLRPGISSMTLDKMIGEIIRDHKAIPSFLDYRGYPFNSCISVNDVVVHGFPNNHPLKEGDIVSIDVGVILNEWHGDHAYTFAIGDPGAAVNQLIRVTKESLYKGIEKAIAGNYVGDIAYAIQERSASRQGTRSAAKRASSRTARPHRFRGSDCSVLRISRTIPAVLLESLIETQNRGRYLSYRYERRFQSDLAWASLFVSSIRGNGGRTSQSRLQTRPILAVIL